MEKQRQPTKRFAEKKAWREREEARVGSAGLETGSRGQRVWECVCVS